MHKLDSSCISQHRAIAWSAVGDCPVEQLNVACGLHCSWHKVYKTTYSSVYSLQTVILADYSALHGLQSTQSKATGGMYRQITWLQLGATPFDPFVSGMLSVAQMASYHLTASIWGLVSYLLDSFVACKLHLISKRLYEGIMLVAWQHCEAAYYAHCSMFADLLHAALVSLHLRWISSAKLIVTVYAYHILINMYQVCPYLQVAGFCFTDKRMSWPSNWLLDAIWLHWCRHHWMQTFADKGRSFLWRADGMMN